MQEIVNSQVGVAHDPAKETLAEISTLVHRNGRKATVGMVEDHVTSALADGLKSVPAQDGQDLAGGKGG